MAPDGFVWTDRVCQPDDFEMIPTSKLGLDCRMALTSRCENDKFIHVVLGDLVKTKLGFAYPRFRSRWHSER